MKDLHLLVWITQLGMTVAAPLAGFALLGVWLTRRFGLGRWVIAVFCFLGLISAVKGLLSTLKMLQEAERKKDAERPVDFNGHD